MLPETKDWVRKAEGGWATLERELRARRSPNHDGACFHAQQRAEKYLKAWLVEQGTTFRKVHDLRYLLTLSIHHVPEWKELDEAADALTTFAVEIRYPGSTASREQARDARMFCTKFRAAIRQKLVLPRRSKKVRKRKPRK